MVQLLDLYLTSPDCLPKKKKRNERERDINLLETGEAKVGTVMYGDILMLIIT